MPFSALPYFLNPKQNPNAWKGTDHDSWLIHWKVRVIGYFAYGPRAREWWAKWRKLPMTLLAVFGNGESRWEESQGLFAVRSLNTPIFLYSPQAVYLSRVQYWCNWHIQIQWPLFFAFHIKFGKKGLVFGYIGAKRDADEVYWFPAIYLGGNWK